MVEDLKAQYLRRMGITLWRLRSAGPPEAPAAGVAAQMSVEPATPAPTGQDPVAPAVRPSAPPGTSGESAPGGDPDSPARTGPAPVQALDWDALQARVTACRDCQLHRTRTRAVFGVGQRDADLLVVGEAPGEEEDRRGEPFVGRAGRLLDLMLRSMGLDRSRVYITNILKCRPPGNRDPAPDEALCCRPYLGRQMALIQPGLILAVGRIAAQNLLDSTEPLGRLRGRVHRLADTGVPLVVTYHPAYLLRQPAAKAKAWQDLRLAMRVAAEAGGG